MKLPASLLVPFAFAAVLAVAAPPAENWENNCASCHGTEGRGDTKQGKRLKIRDYTDSANLANFSDNELQLAIANGVKDEKGKVRMQGFRDELLEDEIKDLVKFIRTMAQKK